MQTEAGRHLRMFRQEHKDGECAPNRAGYCQCPLKDAEEEAEAELICSDTDRGMHLPVIDIDFPIRAVPSATKGHFHLYIHKPVECGSGSTRPGSAVTHQCDTPTSPRRRRERR